MSTSAYGGKMCLVVAVAVAVAAAAAVEQSWSELVTAALFIIRSI